MYLAALNPDITTVLTIVAGILATFGGMLGGFYAISRVMLNQAEKRDIQAAKDRDADRQERLKFAEAVDHMAKNSGKVAESNKLIAQGIIKQAKESEKRNGHLAELITEQGKQTQMIADNAVKHIIKNVNTQTVKEQQVEHQTVKHHD